MKKNSRMIGLLLVISGCFFWGIGGTMAQHLFQNVGITVGWLVSTRLVIAGVLLLAIQALFKDRSQITRVWKEKATAIRLVLFSLVGMLAVQYTYMASIDIGNAAIATLLQYLAPVMIMIWYVLRRIAPFTKRDLITLSLALVGTFLLLTNGSIEALSVPIPAVIWGILSGVTLAFYTLYAIPLLKHWDSLVIVGWAMLLAGITMSLFHQPWNADFSSWPLSTYGYLFVVIIFGTMLAFWFYIESLQTLSAKETSLLGNIEPLTAVVATVVWLKVPFGAVQWIGATLIILMMIYLALTPQKKE
jgi:drug/metabolite transporter (DMT)-like permease